jgi:tetratricopeptide (TPR) repeat protein
VYEQLLADTPGDEKVALLRKLVWEWLHLLSRIGAHPCDSELLQACWMRLDSIALPALRSVVLDMLIEAMRALPDPGQIYAAPRFHLGRMLMEASRFAEAADCFLQALANPGIPRGLLLAWRGDALTLAGEGDTALKSYLAAFLEDPSTVDIRAIRHRAISDLHLSLHFDGEEIEEEEEPAWLPVWGWLNGVFPLHSAPEPATCAADFASLLAEQGCCVPRLWYEMLAHAERVRFIVRDDRELAALRRLLKGSNGFLFALYLEKISGRR